MAYGSNNCTKSEMMVEVYVARNEKISIKTSYKRDGCHILTLKRS
jgi:hypothetical protein